MGEDFLRFYNMSRNPFSKSLPTDMAHPTEDLRQVHARLSHLARTGGIGLVTADPGTGKTFAVRTWAERLNPNTNRLVYLCLSTVTNMEFYRELCQGLGVEPCFKKTDMFRDIQACVRSLVEERRQRVTLVVDEAHYLQTSVLRDLQMLTNFEMDSRDMLAVVLVATRCSPSTSRASPTRRSGSASWPATACAGSPGPRPPSTRARCCSRSGRTPRRSTTRRSPAPTPAPAARCAASTRC